VWLKSRLRWDFQILGLFFLGLISRRAGQLAAFLGMIVGLTVVAVVAARTPIAYPWYALIGSSTVVIVGMLVSVFAPAQPISESQSA
jgi:Na+/proline symporter